MRILFNILFPALISLVAGCNTMYDWLRADPAPQTSFLDDSGKLVDQSPQSPFRRIWIDKDTDLNKYGKIIVAPVNTTHLMTSSVWDKAAGRSITGDAKKDADEMARYMHNSFWSALHIDPLKRFTVVDKPGPDTLMLELALIQLVPSKAELNVTENIVGIIIWPVAFLTVFNSGSTAFEGILRDTQTGKIVCSFADREMDEAAILNIPGMTYYGNAKYFIERWGRQFVALMNAKDHSKLKTDFPFKLIVW
jgi:hypothetical protein